ncbi:MAG: nitroreductase family protein [Candidatus Omnitrophica bacterium]|nr:nitroreductase family protein [Candidatus Omnitrophota bacterium]
MDLLDLIKARRTIRKYTGKKVPQDIIEKIIDAGRWAPSAHNLQPWKFVIIENKDKIDKIADLLNKKADSLFSGFNIVMRDVAKNLKNPGVLMAVYNNKTISKKFSRFGDIYEEAANIYEIQSVSNAIENMLLYSHNLNLGMAWYGMALFCEIEISELLKQDGKLLAILSLGYPDETPLAPRRKEVSEITEFIR